MARVLIQAPASAREGEIIEIKALIAHPMETGYRRDQTGQVFPRNILNRFVCTYDGETIFAADLHPAIAANPFFAFTTRATRSGVLAFSWTDDDGRTQIETARIVVT